MPQIFVHLTTRSSVTMESQLPVVSFEEAVIEEFSTQVHQLRLMELWAESHFEPMKMSIKYLAIELEPYLPETLEEFELSTKVTYRRWIKAYLIKRFVHNSEAVRILMETDRDRVASMTAIEKRIRKRFSDTVSDVLRKIKKYSYEDKHHLKRCTLCELDIPILILQCVNCTQCFHLKCLLRVDFDCTRCGVKLTD
jgi:hypothetical protein